MTALIKSLTLAGFLLATLFATPAEARRYCPRGGYCPIETCTKFNSWAPVQYACVAANCSAANSLRQIGLHRESRKPQEQIIPATSVSASTAGRRVKISGRLGNEET
jgi:hypothetical protein